MREIEAISKAYVVRMGACVLALAVCCGLVAVGRAVAEDPRKHEPQLSADQEEWPLTDITETTDANGIIWGKGMHNGMLREWRLQIPPTNSKPVPLYAYFHGAAGWMTKYDEFRFRPEEYLKPLEYRIEG